MTSSDRKKKKKEKKLQDNKKINDLKKTELEKEAVIKDAENAIFDEHLNARDVEVSEKEIETLNEKVTSKKAAKEHIFQIDNHGIHFHLSKIFENKIVRYVTISVVFVLVISISVLICIIADKNRDIDEYDRMVSVLNDTVNNSKQNITELQKQIDELNESNKAMGETVTGLNDELNALKEADRREKVPSLYPIKGTSAIMNVGMDEDGNAVTVTDNGEGDENVKSDPEVLFQVAVETSVVATGTGTVETVELDETYGYVVTINHGNGYVSIYRAAGVPLVSAGDMVTQGSVIMKIAADNSVFSYQIQLDDSFIDPMTCMEING